ncbi:hypothetical protein [Lysinibacillus fusiformis]
MKRKAVIEQLKKFDVHEIEGLPLDEVLYSTLLKTLALKRAADN